MSDDAPLEFRKWLLTLDISANQSPLIDTNYASESFETWFLAHGGYVHPHVEVMESTAMGRSLRVKPRHSIPKSSIIISCPHSLIFSWSNLHKYHFPDVQLPSCSQNIALRLCLMKQRMLGIASPWCPYIKMLPVSFDTPLYYQSDDLIWIQGTNLGHARKVREEAWRKEYNEAIEMLFSSESDRANDSMWTW